METVVPKKMDLLPNVQKSKLIMIISIFQSSWRALFIAIIEQI